MQKKTFPDFVPPMMAQSAKEAFDSPDWIFEIKLDGYRAITVFDAAGKPHLWSRNGLPLEQKFPAILKAVSRLKLPSTVLDGEIVAVDENGIPRFQLLQRFQKQPTAPTLYFVFDVLWSNGTDITGKTLMERRAVLETIIKSVAGIQLGNYVEGKGKALFELTKSMKTRSRMWSLNTHFEAIESIIRTATSAEGKDLLLVDIEPEERADAILEKVFEKPSEGPLGSVVKEFRKEFSNEAWQHILRAAIEPRARETEVHHTGGPNEQGADVVIGVTGVMEPKTALRRPVLWTALIPRV